MACESVRALPRLNDLLDFDGTLSIVCSPVDDRGEISCIQRQTKF